jgi:hypothetical protein
MVISQKHRYLFVELPNTASTAIRRELCEHYDGMPILRKHAYYSEFLKIASAEEKTYCVFSCIRNPLDVAVTVYVKYKTNHKGVYTDPEKTRMHVLLPRAALRRFNFIRSTGADFPTFLKRFYRFPYNDWSSLSHDKFDFVIRFENLQDDFAKVLELIGVEQKRSLPLVNPTQGKGDFLVTALFPGPVRCSIKYWDFSGDIRSGAHHFLPPCSDGYWIHLAFDRKDSLFGANGGLPA